MVDFDLCFCFKSQFLDCFCHSWFQNLLMLTGIHSFTYLWNGSCVPSYHATSKHNTSTPMFNSGQGMLFIKYSGFSPYIFFDCGQRFPFFLHQSTVIVSKIPLAYLDMVLHTSDTHFYDEITGEVSLWWLFHAGHACVSGSAEWNGASPPLSAKPSCSSLLSLGGFASLFWPASESFLARPDLTLRVEIMSWNCFDGLLCVLSAF